MSAFKNLFSVRRFLGNSPPLGDIPSGAELFKNAMRLAWPSVLETFLMSLVGVIDTIMVSSLGYYAIAAVGLTTQPKFICLAAFISINVALSAVTARRTGENKREEANGVLALCLVIVLILTAVISTLAVVFAGPIIHLAGSAPDTHDAAVTYFRIISGGMIFNVVFLAINAAQRGCGNTKIALRTNMVSNIVNVIFNYFLINGHCGFPALGVEGAAIATVIGTIVASILAFFSLLKRERFLNFHMFRHFRAGYKSMRSVFKIGSNTFEEQLFLRIGFLLFAIIAANLGTAPFAAHQVAMTIAHMSFSLGNGLSFGAIALVGQSLGQKRPDLAKIYGVICQRIGLSFSFILGAIYMTLGHRIFTLFGKDAEILSYAPFLLTIITLVVFMQISQVVYFGCLRGGGDTRFTAISILISVAFIRPFASWLLCYVFGFGLKGVWGGLLTDQFVRFALGYIRFRGGKWLSIRI